MSIGERVRARESLSVTDDDTPKIRRLSLQTTINKQKRAAQWEGNMKIVVISIVVPISMEEEGEEEENRLVYAEARHLRWAGHEHKLCSIELQRRAFFIACLSFSMRQPVGQINTCGDHRSTRKVRLQSRDRFVCLHINTIYFPDRVICDKWQREREKKRKW